ncbi:MAG: protein-L-isoaspartate(D-aspartate) O-methyltransferase [Solirubrobacteraceae bacterium]|jgi:protein-L-isoaspartate(D-aspartate) O-methyltransferase|nr:protein-L-isoaspartate(D-aspartate) O-methyltransferase [Solirubrobacteraceae bacterium]MEA2161267.1 protein-L-isoaspartate(D-aspartate) O-methyltransferase [Solirubrobacteraceae bacterium]
MGNVSGAGDLASQLRASISDERVLAAIASVPRERFVPGAQLPRAYENTALPIACNQTISQPLVVARMLELLELRPRDRVLDVGTGSGYHAVLLARLAGHVWSIERHAELAEQAQLTLAELGVANVELYVGDGWEGLPEYAPYDAINVAAATAERIPQALTDQLAVGGRLIAPVGGAKQHLILARRTAKGLRTTTLEPVRFVPLVRDSRA